MEKYYYTLDVDFYIKENANIRWVEAETYEEAETKIENIFKDNFPNLKEEDIKVMKGEFEECWIRTFSSGYAYNLEQHGFQGVPCFVCSEANGLFLVKPKVDVFIPDVLSWVEVYEDREIEDEYVLSTQQRQRRIIELMVIIVGTVVLSLLIGYSK